MIKGTATFGVCVALLASSSTAWCETKEPERKLPQTGTLSTTISGVYDSRAVETWGDTDDRGQSSAPISGSVSKVGNREWIMKLFNTSEQEGDKFSVDVEVRQLDRRGVTVKTDNYSYTLAPKQSVERSIAGLASAEQAALNIRHWKKVGK